MYMEEVEWCYRIKKAGWQTWFYPETEIFHLVRGSSPEGKQRAILGIYQGLIYFYQKHFASWQLGMLKFLLKAKAAGAWFVGILTGSNYLKQTYEKAFKLACHV
jgi:GT2 family glycosyltransferase